MDVRITEASLFFRITKKPKTYVGKQMPYVVNTTGVDTERVVPCQKDDNLPLWMIKPQKNIIRFMYVQHNIECNYNSRHSVLTMHGIKYKDFERANEYVNRIFSMIDTEYDETPVIRYKAIAKINIRVQWDIDMLADIITNNPKIAQIMAVCERTCTLGEKRFFSIAVSINDNHLCRVALTYRGTQVTAMISKLHDEESAVFVAKALEKLFDIYASANVHSSSTVIQTRISSIDALREKLPELFVNNYTRECPMLPIMISEKEAEHIQSKQRVIYYPMNSDKGRYYTAPEGYFVGLKRNRLYNKHEFPYLVTCYLQDHMKRTSSDTYMYYYAELQSRASRSIKRPLPKAIYDSRYHRKKATSFIHAIESATSTEIGDFPWFPHITKQEMWDNSDEEIMDAIKNQTAGLSMVYRYFEELIGVSIHVVVIKEGNFEPLIPNHIDYYVWEPPYPLHIVIFETYKKTYGKKSCSYSYLAKGEVTLFDETDDVIFYLTSQKSTESLKPPKIVDTVCEQIIDRNGKCKAIITDSGSHIDTYTRPLNVPVAPEKVCFFDSHIRKMNNVKKEMSIQTIDLSKRSTSSVLYFPNDASFQYYVSRKKMQLAS